MDDVFVTLPWPPSVNAYWRSIIVGGKIRTLLSRKGRKYRESAVAELMVAGLNGKRIDGRLAVTIELCGPTHAQRDIDNFTKGIFDALTYAGVWLDDSQVDHLVVYRGDVVKGGRVHVLIQDANCIDV